VLTNKKHVLRTTHGYHQIARSLQKQAVSLQANRTPHVLEALHSLFHWRYRARLELPSRHLTILTGRHRTPLHTSDDDRAAPGIVDVIRALPSPWITRSVDRHTGRC